MERKMEMFKTKIVFLVMLGVFINGLFAAPVTAGNNSLLRKVVENSDFFISYDGRGVYDYEGSLLCDVSDLGTNRIGLLLLKPSGVLKSLVFDRVTFAKIYEDMRIPPRGLRNDLARSGISIPNTRLVAKNEAIHR